MLSSFIDVYPKLNVIINDKARKLAVTQIDFDELISFAKYFKYFVDVTELLSAEKTPTIHLILPLKQRLINLSKSDRDDPQSIMKFKKYFENKIPTYWETKIYILSVLFFIRNLNTYKNVQIKILKSL
jgi:hypothetical protein